MHGDDPFLPHVAQFLFSPSLPVPTEHYVVMEPEIQAIRLGSPAPESDCDSPDLAPARFPESISPQELLATLAPPPIRPQRNRSQVNYREMAQGARAPEEESDSDDESLTESPPAQRDSSCESDTSSETAADGSSSSIHALSTAALVLSPAPKLDVLEKKPRRGGRRKVEKKEEPLLDPPSPRTAADGDLMAAYRAERNRLAAKRSRTRRADYVRDLEATLVELKDNNDVLRRELLHLRREIAALKATRMRR